MFTGIIEEVGAVSRRSGAELAVLAETVIVDAEIGDSIAIDGACMTVAAINSDGFVVQVSPESFERTTLGALRPGDAVNLERAMQLGGRLGGHMVQGHVDGVGRIKAVTRQGEFAFWQFQAPPEVARYLVPKGSVAVDGISLTVVSPESGNFGVAVIPETLAKTKLAAKRPGDAVNLEADMIGKHIFHYLKQGGESGISTEFLARHGFS